MTDATTKVPLDTYTVYSLITELFYDRPLAYTWLINNTVDAHGKAYDESRLQTALIVSGFNEVIASYTELDTTSLQAAVTAGMTFDPTHPNGHDAATPFTLRDLEGNLLETYLYLLKEFISKLIKKFYVKTANRLPTQNETDLTPYQLHNLLSVETIYSLVDNLLYNREAAYDWLAANTVNSKGEAYNEESINSMLIQCRFNDLARDFLSMPTEDIQKSSIINAAIAARKLLSSKVPAFADAPAFEKYLAYFTTLFSLNFLQKGPLNTHKVKVIPSMFVPEQFEGDFAKMIKAPQYKNALFVFNDNEQQYLSRSCQAGGGNAIIRPYQCIDPPRAAGIPTGSHGTGYAKFTSHVKTLIDNAINQIVTICNKYHYDTIYYSSDKDGNLGTGIFNVDSDVKTYIVQQLQQAFN